MFVESPSFPSCPSFGYSSEPMYSVTAIKTAGGHEVRNRNWSRPLHRYNCTVGPRKDEDIAELLEMWHAVGGGESGWATPDPVDPNIIWSSASGSGMVGVTMMRAFCPDS